MCRILLQPAIAFAILLAVTPIAGAAAAEPPEIEWGKQIEGCRFSIDPKQSSFRYDQPLILNMTLKNFGQQKTHVFVSNYMREYRYDVRLPNGKPAPLTLEGSRLANGLAIEHAGALGLAPGDSREQGIMLNRYYDMTLLGEYTVTIYQRIYPPRANATRVEVPSNTVKIVVRE